MIINNLSKSFVFFLFLIIFVQKVEAETITEIVVISAIHGYHHNHETYDYDVLYSLVKSYNPDFIGVEIRSEDVGADENYLKKNYPKEMIVLAEQYSTKVFGFDWLGSTIKNRPIPTEYWKNLEYKKLSRLMDSDVSFSNKKPDALNVIEENELELIQLATITSLHDGRLDQLQKDKRLLWQKYVESTPYEKIVEFDKARDEHIGKNITDFIAKNAGSRIVLIMGGAHRVFAIENISNKFRGSVKFLPVKDSSVSSKGT